MLLKNYRQFEGVSAFLWSSKAPLSFEFVCVYHEEQIEDTCVYWIKPLNKSGLVISKYPTKVHYNCETIAHCVPQINKDFELDKKGRLL